MKMSFDNFIRYWVNDKKFAEQIISNPGNFPNIINGLYRVYRAYDWIE